MLGNPRTQFSFEWSPLVLPVEILDARIDKHLGFPSSAFEKSVIPLNSDLLVLLNLFP
jgi:hypothetical protein